MVGGFKVNIAYPEKALLDKIYLFLQRNPFAQSWLEELRLQNLDDFDIQRFEAFASGLQKKKPREAVIKTCRYISQLKGELQ